MTLIASQFFMFNLHAQVSNPTYGLDQVSLVRNPNTYQVNFSIVYVRLEYSDYGRSKPVKSEVCPVQTFNLVANEEVEFSCRGSAFTVEYSKTYLGGEVLFVKPLSGGRSTSYRFKGSDFHGPGPGHVW